MALGQGAGVGAALAAGSGSDTRGISTAELVRRLGDMGAILQ